MKSAAPAALPRPLVLQKRHASSWSRTVAVIRIPRFTVRELMTRRAGKQPEPAFAEATAGKPALVEAVAGRDGLAAFATERELAASRRIL